VTRNDAVMLESPAGVGQLIVGPAGHEGAQGVSIRLPVSSITLMGSSIPSCCASMRSRLDRPGWWLGLVRCRSECDAPDFLGEVGHAAAFEASE
jgi:hypothetical protein